ncbi:MAG: metallophosphoesterase [Bryobacteraceae bacterium]|nr:metallophosphoesterase [Bryobacteraceae bacterium]
MRHTICGWLILGLVAIAGCAGAPPPPLEVSESALDLPREKDSLKFAVLGDTGTGGREQLQVANVLTAYRQIFPFEMALLLGDNLYGRESPQDYLSKFERPYKALLDGGVKFYATLGNHDEPDQRLYKHFNMGGRRYYSFQPKDGIRFFSLDSTYMTREQLEWIEKELKGSDSPWKIIFFHHPIYSSGRRHGSNVELRKALEPLFVEHGVDLVLAGHEHFYLRMKPQKGIHHIIEGGSAKLRRGNIRADDLVEKGFDSDRSFMLMEIAGDRLYFQAISRTNETVDSGVIVRREARDEGKAAAAAAR